MRKEKNLTVRRYQNLLANIQKLHEDYSVLKQKLNFFGNEYLLTFSFFFIYLKNSMKNGMEGLVPTLF